MGCFGKAEKKEPASSVEMRKVQFDDHVRTVEYTVSKTKKSRKWDNNVECKEDLEGGKTEANVEESDSDVPSSREQGSSTNSRRRDRRQSFAAQILMASTRWGHQKDYRQRKMSLHGKPIYYAPPPKLMISVFTFLERPEARNFSAIYHVFTFLLVCASLIVTVFVTIEEHTEVAHRVMFILEIILVVVFSVELFARVWSAGCRLRYQGFKGRLRFLRKPFCIIDIVVVISSLIIIILGNQETSFAATAMRGLRFLQVLRMVRVDRRGGTWKLLGSVVSAHSKELITAWYIGFLALIFASFLVYQVEKEVNKEEFGTFADALWWGLITLTTIGYGDKTPHTWAGRLIASCFAILGISFFALPAGILGSGFALKVQEQHRQKHFARRQTPAAVLIQCFWRCYAADADSTSTATWQPYLRGFVVGNNSQGKKTLKKMFMGAHGNRIKSWGRMDNDPVPPGFESNARDDFMKGAFGRLHRLGSTNRKSSDKKDPPHLDAELDNSDDDSSTRSSDTFPGEFSEPQKIAIRLIRMMKYQVARREFKEALRPYDVKDVIEQYSSGHDDMLARVKNLQSRVDCIVGIKSSATSPSMEFTRNNSVFRQRGISVSVNKAQVNSYEKDISMNERLINVESSVSAIERKLDQLLAFNNNGRSSCQMKVSTTPPDLKLSEEEDSEDAVPVNCESAVPKKTRYVGFSRDLRSPRLKRRNDDEAFSDTKFFSTESCKDILFFTDDERCEPPISDQIIDIEEEYETVGQKTPLLESCDDRSNSSPSTPAMQTVDIIENDAPRQATQFTDRSRTMETAIC